MSGTIQEMEQQKDDANEVEEDVEVNDNVLWGCINHHLNRVLSSQIKELEEEEGGGSSDNSGSGNDSNDSRTKKSKVRSDDGTWPANSSGAQSRPPKTVNVPIHLFFKGESEDDALMMYDFLKVNKKTANGFNMNTKYFRGGRKTAGRCIEILRFIRRIS